jgi:hypothetical protein
VPAERWQAVLEESRKDLDRKQDDAQLKAGQFRIKPPSYLDDILEDFNQELEEDNPDVHPTLQALTRLSEPSVHVVCVHHTSQGFCLDASGVQAVDLNQEPTLGEVRQLLRATLTLSHAVVAREFLAREVPRAWQRCALLRHHRIAEFDAQGTVLLGDYLLRLDPELGAVFEKPRMRGIEP